MEYMTLGEATSFAALVATEFPEWEIRTSVRDGNILGVKAVGTKYELGVSKVGGELAYRAFSSGTLFQSNLMGDPSAAFMDLGMQISNHALVLTFESDDAFEISKRMWE